MRHIIVVFVILNFGCRTKETVKKNIADPDTMSFEEEEYDEGETGCVFLKTNRNLQDTYPFNKSDKIELVSYDARQDSYSNDELIHDGKFTLAKNAFAEIRQRVELRRSQWDSLFSILYNFRKIKQGDVEPVADSYNPRHSMVFYQNGKAIAYLEVCFECSRTRQTKGVDFGQFCDGKWCTLHKFFKTN